MNVRYGIVGCGFMSQYYLDGLQRLPAPIVHVADVDREQAQACGDRVGARVSSDYRALLDDAEVDTVVVLTHTRHHLDICLDAIAAGKDIICEKTLADSGSHALRIAQAVQVSKSLFFVAYMKRFFPAVQKAKALLEELGPIYSVYARSYQYWGNLYDLAPGFSDEMWLRKYGGGLLKCAGSHILDLLLYLFGRPAAVYANVDYVPDSRLDRRDLAILEYDGPMTATFEAAGHNLSRIGVDRNGWDERIEINGANGRLDLYLTLWNKPEEYPALLVHYDERTQTGVEHRFDAVNTFHHQLAHFDQCLKERRQGSPDVVSGMDVDWLISAITQAAEKKSRQRIEWPNLDTPPQSIRELPTTACSRPPQSRKS